VHREGHSFDPSSKPVSGLSLLTVNRAHDSHDTPAPLSLAVMCWGAHIKKHGAGVCDTNR